MRSLLVVVIAPILIGSPAYGLRGVFPLTECDRLVEIEAGLGSRFVRTVPPEPSAAYRVLFEGNSRGHAASVSYNCESGKVILQMILIKADSENGGRTIFSDWRSQLVADFGQPFIDLDVPSVADIEKEVGSSVRRVATWVSGGRVITVTFFGTGDETWHITIHGP